MQDEGVAVLCKSLIEKCAIKKLYLGIVSHLCKNRSKCYWK